MEISENGANWTRVQVVDWRSTAFSLTGLRPGAKYWVRILAENSVGSSTSAPRSFTTTNVSEPKALGGLQIQSRLSKLIITWAPPSGDEVLSDSVTLEWLVNGKFIKCASTTRRSGFASCGLISSVSPDPSKAQLYLGVSNKSVARQKLQLDVSSQTVINTIYGNLATKPKLAIWISGWRAAGIVPGETYQSTQCLARSGFLLLKGWNLQNLKTAQVNGKTASLEYFAKDGSLKINYLNLEGSLATVQLMGETGNFPFPYVLSVC